MSTDVGSARGNDLINNERRLETARRGDNNSEGGIYVPLHVLLRFPMPRSSRFLVRDPEPLIERAAAAASGN